MSSLDDRLLPVFAQQHWLVSMEDVRDAGGSSQAAHDRLQLGRWEQADRRVYRLVGAPTSWQQAVLAPILSAGRDVTIAASHHTAAVLHGVPGYGKGRPELTTPREFNLRRDGVRIHTSTDLKRSTIVVRDGIPVTDINRTILDLGRYESDRRVHRAVEWARRKSLTDWDQLIATLARHARRGRSGIRRLRRVIVANAHRQEITDSDFELLLLALLREHGLPEPVLHHRVYAGDRFVAEVDMAYPERRLALEADGPSHLKPEVRERDLPRQNDLMLLGWDVLRFTWERYVARPERIVAEVRTAYEIAAPRAAA